MTAAIELREVSMRFGEVQALERVSFAVTPREFVAVVGPSGCGKSTLLRIVAGLATPSGGDALVDGRRVGRPHPEVGIVFQNAVLFPWASVTQNIEAQFRMRGESPEPHRARIRSLIALARLEGFERHLPHQLSGGMQQRVSICRALVHEPRLLLLDEPFGALDAMTREGMNLELQRIWLEWRNTVLMITHGIAEAAFLADRVVVMSARPGRVLRILDVDFPRPRDLDIVEDPRFRGLVREIRAALST
jgi:NitT/TauT family transport system ATP-binding protein